MELDALVTEWLTLPDVADLTGLSLSKLRQLVREGRLVTIPRGKPPVQSVPAELVRDGELIKGLAGALTVLRDAGYTDVQALRWLLTVDDTIGARPVDEMGAGRHTAVKRRAQALAF